MPLREETDGHLARHDPIAGYEVSPMGAYRQNAHKPPIHLVASSVITAIAEASRVGAEDYGERNWEKGFQYSTTYASLMRHLIAWWQGEDVDPKSKLPHSYHVAWNAHAIVEQERRIAEGSLPKSLDNRPKHPKLEADHG